MGLICLFTYFISETKDLHINLSKSDSLISIVTKAYGRTFDKAGVRWVSTKDYFYFTLYGSEQQFAIDRTNEGYSDLERAIKPGDTVKIYYSNTTEIPNTNIYQLEKNGTVLESYKSYQKRNASSAGLSLFTGIILTVLALGYYFKLNLITILAWPVEGNKASG